MRARSRIGQPCLTRSVKRLKVTVFLITIQTLILLAWVSSHWVSIYSIAGLGNFSLTIYNEPDSTTLEIMNMEKAGGAGWWFNDFTFSKHSTNKFVEPKSFSDTLSGTLRLDFKGGPTGKMAIPYWLIAGIPGLLMVAIHIAWINLAQNKPRHSSPDRPES